MSATADKARYFLEQSVPELKELERKKIFTPQETTSIARKRSDFEHKINARGSTPADYARYAEFEINLDQLRKKRTKRLGVKTTVHHGQRRVFFVFDRGNRKFPGDLQLWMQSIEYARGQKALKKVTQMLTNAIRLHPTKSDLWMYAAQFALDENGDMTEARAYMQRGLRFCKTSKQMWLQNFRLEVNWIAKIHARRQVLGIENDAAIEEKVKVVGNDDDDNMILLPKLTADDFVPDEEDKNLAVDVPNLEHLDSTPVMTGAIPMAIFDMAMQEFLNDGDLAFRFFQELDLHPSVPVARDIGVHISDKLQAISENGWQACATLIDLATFGVDVSSPEFPAAVRKMLSELANTLARSRQRSELLDWSRQHLTRLAQNDLDPALIAVLQSKLLSLR